MLSAVDRGELGEPLAVVAYLAGQRVELPESELNQGRRRSMLLVAAGGDPHRELGVDDRAVKALAADLHTEERQAQLAAGLDELAVAARDLDRARARPCCSSRRTSISPGGSSRSACSPRSSDDEPAPGG